jgi:membrane-associated protease RseP (regulator of RpoE activity)
MLQLESFFPLLIPLLPWLIILLAWIILFFLDATLNLEKHGIDVGPFMVMARTQRFNNLLNRIGRWHPRAWRYLWSGFVGVCFAFSIIGFYLLLLNLLSFVVEFGWLPQAVSPGPAGPIVPLVPGITMSFLFFLTLLVPLIVSIIAHEMGHGIAARADDIPVKSSGLFALFFLFGAFVEPDEEYVRVKTTRRERVRFFAAGSAANIFMAFIVTILTLVLVVRVPQGVLITDVSPGSSADGVLSPWTVITGMNETTIATADDLGAFLDNTSPGDLIVFTVNGETVNLIVGAHPQNASRAYVGIYLTTYVPLIAPLNLLGPSFGIEFQRSLLWFYVISLSLGVMNLLPIPPLDGDRLFKELIDATISLERRSGRILLNSLRIFALMLLVLNIVFTFLRPDLLFLFFG